MHPVPASRRTPEKKKNNNKLHSHFLQFLLVITVPTREIEDNSYAKFGWVNMRNYCSGSLLDSSDHWLVKSWFFSKKLNKPEKLTFFSIQVLYKGDHNTSKRKLMYTYSYIITWKRKLARKKKVFWLVNIGCPRLTFNVFMPLDGWLN